MLKIFNLANKKAQLNISSKSLAIWSPVGSNTAKFSLELGQEIARHTSVAITELPCQGIPRLGFISEIVEREKCVENALQELEKTGYLSLNQLKVVSERLALLTASVYASPDYPLINRLSLQTLMDYPVKFRNTARQLGYNVTLFECQGQLTSPMTFFALKCADIVLVVVQQIADLAFVIINIKHLVQTFKFPSAKIFLVGDVDPLSLNDLIMLKDEEGDSLGNLTIIRQQAAEVLQLLTPQKDRYPTDLGKIPLCAEGQNG